MIDFVLALILTSALDASKPIDDPEYYARPPVVEHAPRQEAYLDCSFVWVVDRDVYKCLPPPQEKTQ